MPAFLRQRQVNWPPATGRHQSRGQHSPCIPQRTSANTVRTLASSERHIHPCFWRTVPDLRPWTSTYLSLDLLGRRDQHVILDAEFLRNFGLLVDVRRKRLLDATTYLSVSGIASRTSSLCLTQIPENGTCPFSNILKEFPDLTRPCNTEVPVRHHVTHHIETSGPPVHARPRRLPPTNCGSLVNSSSICLTSESSARP